MIDETVALLRKLVEWGSQAVGPGLSTAVIKVQIEDLDQVVDALGRLPESISEEDARRWLQSRRWIWTDELMMASATAVLRARHRESPTLDYCAFLCTIFDDAWAEAWTSRPRPRLHLVESSPEHP